jgi:tRNA pseudouridine38-40 synthase
VRIALGVEYDGTAFHGWQTQASGNTVQDALENALSVIAGDRIATTCAGRTDAGVHAWQQVVHFDTMVERPDNAWLRGTNSHLVSNVRVRWVQRVDVAFHARFSAIGRHYRYYLCDDPIAPGLWRNYVGWQHQRLHLDHMRQAAARLLGTHDFSAFRDAQCQARSPVRELRRLSVERRDSLLCFHFEANGFLHHMVRNIVASLIWVGAGKRSVEWMAALLAMRDRSLAGPTALACGLHLVAVDYPAQWEIPPAPERWCF